MLSSIQSIGLNQASSYYEVDDYYQSGELMPSEFGGSLASELGLQPGTGNWSRDKFVGMLKGEFPNQYPLAEKKLDTKRVAFDLTWSAPKSASIIALVYGNDQMVLAHNAAVAKAMLFIEKMAVVRVTSDKKTENVYTNKIVYASFVHTTSREGDPQLHTHTVVANKQLINGKLMSLDVGVMQKNIKLAGAIYRDELAAQARSMGFKTVESKNGYEFVGVSTAQQKEFSKRSAQIEKYLVEKGIDRETATSSQKQFATLETRKSKENYERGELQNWWTDRLAYEISVEKSVAAGVAPISQLDFIVARHQQKELAGAHWDKMTGIEQIKMLDVKAIAALKDAEELKVNLNKPGPAAPGAAVTNEQPDGQPVDHKASKRDLEAIAAIKLATASLMERQALIPNKGLLIEAACRLNGYEIGISRIIAAVDDMIEKKDTLAKMKTGEALTTHEMIKTETSIRDVYKNGLNKHTAIATKDEVNIAIAKTEIKLGGAMTSDQRKMITNICIGKNRVMTVNGDAGTGKSTGMSTINSLSNELGYQVLGLAPSAGAVEELVKVGIKTSTVQHAALSTKWAKQLNSKTIVIMDEAGLVGNSNMSDILRCIDKAGARLCLVGDKAQFSAVEAGKPFAQLYEMAVEDGNAIRLAEMRRGQTDEIKALHFASRDDQSEAVKLMHDDGRIKAFKEESERIDYIAKEFAGLTLSEQADALILTGTNASRIKINQQLREELGLTAGVEVDSFEKKSVTRAEMLTPGTYENGDKIQFSASVGAFNKGSTMEVVGPDDTRKGWLQVKDSDGKVFGYNPVQHSHGARLGTSEKIQVADGEIVRFTNNEIGQYRNGDRGRVTGIDENGMASVQLFHGKSIQVDLKKDELTMRHGYASTGHSAQGMTAKSKVFIHATADDSTLNKQSFYTNMTRSTRHVELVTDTVGSQQIAEFIGRASVTNEKSSAVNMIDPQNSIVQKMNFPTPMAAFWSSDPKKMHEFIQVKPDDSINERMQEAIELYGNNLSISGSDAFAKNVAKNIILIDPVERKKLTMSPDMYSIVKELEDRELEMLANKNDLNNKQVSVASNDSSEEVAPETEDSSIDRNISSNEVDQKIESDESTLQIGSNALEPTDSVEVDESPMVFSLKTATHSFDVDDDVDNKMENNINVTTAVEKPDAGTLVADKDDEEEDRDQFKSRYESASSFR